MTVTEPHTSVPRTRNSDVRLDRAFAAAADPAVKVVSLDVFDTMLWRRVADPVDAFPIVGERLHRRDMLLEHMTPHAFAKLRRAAEQRARNAVAAGGGGIEVTLDQIYAQIPPGVFNDLPVDDAWRVEVEVERELLAPDLDVVELVRAARAGGKRVAAVSDTYFSAEQLRSFLEPHYAGDAAVDAVFASSEHGRGKGDELFAVMLAELGVDPREVVHVGDNEQADVEGARRHGIRSLLFERRPRELERLLERERHYLDPESVDTGGDYGLAAIRGKVLHRREYAELPEELQPFWRYGALALGPALTGFAEWVHERAEAARATKALCLMREGALLADMVNAAAGYLASDVQGKPLWLSRQVSARAAIFEGRETELEALLSRRNPPLVRELCATLGVDVAASPLLAQHAETRLNEYEVRDEVISELASNPDLRGEIVARARLLRERVLAYVARVLPEGERTMLLVDLGWGGTIQKLLQDVLHHSESGVSTVGLYLVTNEVATERILDGIDLSGFLAGQGVPGVATRAIMRSPEILEQVCMPDVGTQLDLDSDLEPVLDEAVDRDRVQAAERAAVQKGIRAFQREWSRYAPLEGRRVRLTAPGARRQMLAQVARATVAPTPGEAAVFGSWVHDENFGSRGYESIVGADHHRRALRHMDPETLIEIPFSELYWPFGLAALEDEHLAQSIEAVATGLVQPGAFYSALEAGDLEVYFDNGYGFGPDWRVRVEGRRNRFGLSYARATLRGEEVRAIRIDPVRAQCLLRIDWIALTCWVRGESVPRRLAFDTHEALARFRMRQLTPAGAKFYMAEGDDPQMELDVRAELDGAAPYEVLVEVAYAVMLVDPRGEDAAHSRELERRVQRRSRAAKRFVRQLENRTGVPLGQPLRRAYRKLRGR